MDAFLDGRSIQSESDFYAAWVGLDGVPEWVGHNLDALWDTATGLIEHQMTLYWRHADHSQTAMGDCFDKIVDVLRESEVETQGHFQIRLVNALN